ncbi:MAG: hypothetical protein JHC33_05555 [Ignisphaera sp.]|nr:hypothetical protein [Ignisphaera sp.]
MKRFAPVIALVIAAVVLGAVNATVFAYRWMQGTVTVAGPTAARGAACVGFYSSALQNGITLPPAGTNYNAQTYGTNTKTVTPGQVACQWTSSGGATYSLYESISVNVPITVGSWYIRDFYGFGYYGTSTDPTVYVYIKVEQPITDPNIASANLTLYNAKTGAKVAVIDLTTGKVLEGPGAGTTIAGSITLSPGDALQLDLSIRATGTTTSATFKVGFYVSQEQEAPR